MRRTVLLTALLALACAPAAAEWLPLTGGHRAQTRCTATHRCATTLSADDRLQRWTTPQTFPADASLQVRVSIDRHPYEGINHGLQVVWLKRGAIVTATAKPGKAPLVVRYVADHPRRVRVVYWAD